MANMTPRDPYGSFFVKGVPSSTPVDGSGPKYDVIPGPPKGTLTPSFAPNATTPIVGTLPANPPFSYDTGSALALGQTPVINGETWKTGGTGQVSVAPVVAK
jgi:hypothetical protein